MEVRQSIRSTTIYDGRVRPVWITFLFCEASKPHSHLDRLLSGGSPGNLKWAHRQTLEQRPSTPLYKPADHHHKFNACSWKKSRFYETVYHQEIFGVEVSEGTVGSSHRKHSWQANWLCPVPSQRRLNSGQSTSSAERSSWFGITAEVLKRKTSDW